MEATLEGLKAKDALALFNETVGPGLEIKDGIFHYLIKQGLIVARGEHNGRKLYDRASVIAAAKVRKEEEGRKHHRPDSLLVVRDAIAYCEAKIKEALGENATFNEYELTALARAGEIVVKTEMIKGYQRKLYDRRELDVALHQVIERKRMESKIAGLMDSRQATAWINARLAEQGRETYDPDVLLDIFYHWVGDGRVNKSLIVPGKSGSMFWRYYFSEQDLREAPCFQETPVMPSDVKPIEVRGTKQMRMLEEKWGDLITRRGAFEENLSQYALTKKVRVRPVGFMGPSKIYPAKYIPKKRRHRGALDI